MLVYCNCDTVMISSWIVSHIALYGYILYKYAHVTSATKGCKWVPNGFFFELAN